MALLFAALSMAFLLSAPTFLVLGVVALGSILFGFPPGWAIVLAILSFGLSRNVWQSLSNLQIGVNGIRTNGEAALALSHLTALVAGLFFATSLLPHRVSAWWGLLLPLAFVPLIATQIAFHFLLGAINPDGVKQQSNQKVV